MWRKIIDDYRNIWMICLKLKWFFYGLSRMLQFSQFVWTLKSYSVWDVFNNFLLIDATDRSKISNNLKRFFIALSLCPLSFFANTPFKCLKTNLIPFRRINPVFVFFYCFLTNIADPWFPQPREVQPLNVPWDNKVK